MNKVNFKKKVYRKPDTSLFSEALPLSSITSTTKPMIPSIATKSLRGNLKKTFPPLLIDVFEMVDHYMSNATEDIEKSSQQILERLEEPQKDIEETQCWCDGVILQIATGIEEGREALGEKEENLLKK